MKKHVAFLVFAAVVMVSEPLNSAASGAHVPIPPAKPDIFKQASLQDIQGPLDPHDANLYRRIFDAQDNGAWDQANQYIDALKNRLLMGHVLYQRYMHPHYSSSFAELSEWMRLYANHTGAERVYRLVERKFPDRADDVRAPITTQTLRGMMPSLRHYHATASEGLSLPRSIRRSFHRHISRGQASAALRLINRAEENREIKTDQAARAKARIAATYLHLGEIGKARDLAFQALKQSKGNAPIAGWVSGLTAWRARDYAAAAAFFERTASAQASAWTRSAGAYWAARAHMRVGNHDQVVHWLEQAAEYPRSFYGLIATRALNRDFDFNWSLRRGARAARDQLASLPQIQRAEALMLVGRRDLAEDELATIDTSHDTELRQALGAYAIERNLPGFSLKFASRYRDQKGAYFDLGLYPSNPWMDEASQADQALINAFIRQESRFNSAAKNASGATGLMQIMPSTASFITGNDRLETVDKHQLKDPYINVQIGGSYLDHLMRLDSVDGDLFSLAIAYNAGPGNLARWKRTMADIDDPLLFIEMIPMSETRAFVERVMANYWIYRHRFGQDTPTLEAVASGTWPVYAGLPGRQAY